MIRAIVRRYAWCIALTLLCATAFGRSTDSDRLAIGLSGEVTSVDPHWNNSGPNVEVALHIFEPLVMTDGNGRLTPGLATDWHAVSPLVWEFHLREGVRFHDGSPLTAQDVVYSLQRPMKLSGSPAPFTQFVKAIVKWDIVEPLTVRLTTAKPYVLLPADLNSVMIVSQKKAEGSNDNRNFDSGGAAIGTGPYRLGRFVRGDRIELERNDDYWGAKPQFRHVTLRLLSNNAARLSALLAGEVDAIENVPPSDVQTVRHAGFTVSEKPSWRTVFLQMDQRPIAPQEITDLQGHPLKRNPFVDERVRRAVSLAIDRDALTRYLMEGLAIPASNLVSPGIFGYNPALKPDPFDPEKAKALLRDAGYANGFRLPIYGPNNRYINDAKVVQAIASMLSRVGLETEVRTMPWTAYVPKARTARLPLDLIGWGSSIGDNTVRSQLGSHDDAKGYGAWNFGRYSDPTLDAHLDQDFQMFDNEKREASARALMAEGLGHMPVVLLYHQIMTWGLRSALAYPGRVDEFTLSQFFTTSTP